MDKHPKLKIYQGIIEHLLTSTNYTLKDIADLTDSTIKSIQSIYNDNYIPSDFLSEVPLIKLYQIILEIQTNKTKPQHFSE